MKIGVFALKDYKKSKDLPKFVLAANRINLDIEFFNPKDIFVSVCNNHVGVYKKNGGLLDLDGAINWIPYAKYDEISYAFECMNIPYINSIDAVRSCRNKVLTNLILSKHYFKQPYSLYYPHMNFPSEIKPDLAYPFVAKKKNGSHGIGAHKLNVQNDFANLLNKKFPKDSLYFQEYIKNEGFDYRILAVGGKVVGGIRKYYKKGEWRTHVAHGGSVEYYDVPEYMNDICIDVSKALKLHFAGVDIMTGIDGEIYILEVNSVPGMSILHNLTGINMAEEILLHLKALINQTEHRGHII